MRAPQLRSSLLVLVVLAALGAVGCKQQQGEVCEDIEGRTGSDCGSGLKCCGAVDRDRAGSIMRRGMCVPIDDDCAATVRDAGAVDAARSDSGPSDSGAVQDAGRTPDSGAIVDSGAVDAGDSGS